MPRFRPDSLLSVLCLCATSLLLHAEPPTPNSTKAPAAAAPHQAKPPRATLKPHLRDIHGEKFVDNYFWLREKENPDVIAYLKAENDYTTAMSQPTTALREQIFNEMKGRMKETDASVPYRYGPYYYYTRTVAGEQYGIRCRKRGSLDAPEEVLLDQNELAKGHDYFSLGSFEISPDHSLLAYAVDFDGSEQYTLQVKELATGKILPDQILNTSGSVAWANDNTTLFYTTLDDAHRPFKLFRHRLGSSKAKDPLLHHEADERFYMNVGRTRSGQYVLMSLDSKLTSECWYLQADEPEAALKVVAPRRQGVEYSVDQQGDRFIIITNDKAVNFKLMAAPLDTPGVQHWKELLPYESEVKLDGVSCFEKYLVLSERREGVSAIRVCALPANKTHVVTWPEPAHDVGVGTNEEYQTTKIRLTYTSLVTPRSTYDYDMQAQTLELKKQEPVKGYQSDLYESRRTFAKSADGTLVPISLVFKKSLKKAGPQPLIMDGYGSYGASEDPAFSSGRISLLDRGVIYAIAHIRGGGEMGRPWYENGKLQHKQHTFDDFIACAEQLIAEKYTSSDKLGIWGGSAGGLLIGAVINQRPELFQAAVADVPFVDVVNTMLDPTIPLTVTEYEEWGNPAEKPSYDVIRKYSPYDNVTAQAYPHLLITAGLNDPRVAYWEPAKWTARLRATSTGSNVILLKTNMGAGHGGESGRYEHLRENAFIYAFLLNHLGVTKAR